MLHLSKLVVWGYSWGRGVRFHLLEAPARRAAALLGVDADVLILYHIIVDYMTFACYSMLYS